MPARVHLLCGIDPTADIGSPAVLRLVPSRRASTGPDVLALGDFVDLVVARNDAAVHPLSTAQRRLLADEVVHEVHAQGKLRHFANVFDTRGFAEGLTNLLGEVQRLDVTPLRFARAVVRSDERGPKEREIARIGARYARELQRLRRLDPDGRTAHAAALLRAGKRAPFDEVRTVFVAGFNDFTEVQYLLLAALAERLDDLWILIPDSTDDARDDLFAVPRATLARLRDRFPAAESVRADARPRVTPVAIGHLSRQLFRPPRTLEVSDNAEGISLIEAPGPLGEARLVARRIKTLLLNGVAPDRIVVALRDLDDYADLLHEVFDEYGLPIDIEGTEPLQRNGAVSALLRAVRVPEDFSFAGVTALLRNTYFRPAWPEAEESRALETEALLRLLGEPRGREAYLTAARRWAVEVQPGLEDEQAEESRRRRTHELAQRCLPFLERFFRTWDDAPATAPLAEHIAWLHRFADAIGIAHGTDERDSAALARFWDEVSHWLARQKERRPLDRRTFHRRLAALATATGLARTPRSPGRVRVLSAEEARHVDVDYLFLMGLGEPSFPRLSLPPTLLDESDRQSLRKAGIPFPLSSDLLPSEMSLFHRLVTRPRSGLVLSYPAVDERGQAELPCSFLLAVLDCFAPGTIPVERRLMLTERLGRDEPLSPAEYRLRGARDDTVLAPPTVANLRDAADLVRQRFQAREYTPFDGRFRDPAVVGEVAHLFGPERIFSPTALEDYVACPFRFLLKHVLRLEPLEDPREEIEVTRRGQAFHRALARLHRTLKEGGMHAPTDAVRAAMLHQIDAAVAEDVSRAPSPASKELWRLEGKRLLRVAARYGEQWSRFVEPWRPRGVAPRPHFFEVDFGLPAADGTMPHGPLVIRFDGIEVRISGRIDRVDVVELSEGVGFWIIDYKTGRASHYTSPDLAEFRRLQLTLYALAVEEVLLADRGARPLGLAYWLVADTGPKVVLPASRNQLLWLEETGRWQTVRATLQGWIATVVAHIRAGDFPLAPRSEHCTDTCPYGQVCRIAQSRSLEKEGRLALPAIGGTTN